MESEILRKIKYLTELYFYLYKNHSIEIEQRVLIGSMWSITQLSRKFEQFIASKSQRL